MASSQVTWKHLSSIHNPNKQHILGAFGRNTARPEQAASSFSNNNHTSGMRKLYIF
jgi:hypothetical protein